MQPTYGSNWEGNFMNHPLFIGHFDPEGKKGLSVIRPVDLGLAYRLISEMCDKSSDGTPMIGSPDDPPLAKGRRWVGRLEQEDVVWKDGYLICPWLGHRFNRASINFVVRFSREAGCLIYEPGDGMFYTPEELLRVEGDYYK
jgi:hypothetical protein